jgi:hypothetical protein
MHRFSYVYRVAFLCLVSLGLPVAIVSLCLYYLRARTRVSHQVQADTPRHTPKADTVAHAFIVSLVLHQLQHRLAASSQKTEAAAPSAKHKALRDALPSRKSKLVIGLLPKSSSSWRASAWATSKIISFRTRWMGNSW